MPFPRTSPRMHMLSISTTSVVKRQEAKWPASCERERHQRKPQIRRGDPDDTERARPHMHNDGHAKVQDQSTPGGGSQVASRGGRPAAAWPPYASRIPSPWSPPPSRPPGTMTPAQPRAAATGFRSSPPGSANPTTPNLRQPLAADHGQPATSLQHARPPAPRTSQVFAGDQPTPAPAADPFSLADPATAGAILATSGFTAVKITGVHETVYDGPDAASALRGMLSRCRLPRLSSPR